VVERRSLGQEGRKRPVIGGSFPRTNNKPQR
jgi:hypothetical protein